MEEVIHSFIEDAVVVPGMGVGFTDSSELRNRGQISYGFSGGLNAPEIAKGVHGHNERVSIESFKLNCQMVYEVTRRMCTGQ
jgi:acetylornithine deacetylase/succinyl-diaminopimelate desuccinylase-like protein